MNGFPKVASKQYLKNPWEVVHTSVFLDPFM
jgi:hypothetical protein